MLFQSILRMKTLVIPAIPEGFSSVFHPYNDAASFIIVRW